MLSTMQQPAAGLSGSKASSPLNANQAEELASPELWYLVYTKPRQEQVALANLQQQGYLAYLPLFKVMQKPMRHDAAAALPGFEPMFARYVFFSPGNPRQSIAGARSTRGVNSIVSFGFVPATVGPVVLAAIRACEEDRNQADLAQISPFQPGCMVRLRAAGLQSLQGMVHSVSVKRVTLLLEILGRQKLVAVEHHQVELV